MQKSLRVDSGRIGIFDHCCSVHGLVGLGLCLQLCPMFGCVVNRSVELGFVNLVPLVESQGLIWPRWLLRMPSLFSF